MGWVIRAIFDDPTDMPAWLEILLVCPDGTTVSTSSPTATAFHEDMRPERQAIPAWFSAAGRRRGSRAQPPRDFRGPPAHVGRVQRQLFERGGRSVRDGWTVKGFGDR